MIQPIDITLKGTYAIYDSNYKLLVETDNLITDWGMSRLFGDWSTGTYVASASYAKAFVSNFANIFIGSGYTGVDNYQPAGMSTPISTSVISTSSVDTTMTGTTYSTDSTSGIATIIFSRSQKFTFSGSDTIREIGCSWNTTPAANNVDGLFSRAELSPANEISFQNGTTVFVRYNLTVTLPVYKSSNAITPFLTSSGVPALPATKSVIRRLPFYTLNQNGTPDGFLNNNQPETTTIDTVFEYIPPLFEDFGGRNDVYVGDNGNNSPTTQGNYPEGSRKWFLSNRINGSFGITASTALDRKNFETASTVSAPAGTVDKEAIDVIDILGGGSGNHTWSKIIRFVFPPGSSFWASSVPSLILIPKTRSMKDLDNTPLASEGLHVIPQTSYGPFTASSGVYVGLEYRFNFTRS
jgi:hypothetical protein